MEGSGFRSCGDQSHAVECGIEVVHGGDVGAGSAGAASVFLSGLEGGGEWACGLDDAAGGDGADAGPGGGRHESGAAYIRADVGSYGRRVDLDSGFGFDRRIHTVRSGYLLDT